jgi:hypothetical protein
VVRGGLDRKATKELGAPVFKTCERCSGNGFSVVPSATVHRAILKRLPDLHQSSWSRNWKPFYEGLVDMLLKRQAAAEFERRPFIDVIETDGGKFCTIELTLHKIVLYASNHGYVHPNETDSEPCQPAGFCFLGKRCSSHIFLTRA